MRSRKPLGCFTSIGLLATVVSLALILVAASASSNGIFSPGELNAQSMGMSIGAALSHSELECSACHPAFWSGISMRDRCLDCHLSIALELSQPGSLHGSFDSALACQDCHRDHRGADAPLTEFESVRFPHESVGFSLRAHHGILGKEPFDCHVCHTESVRRFDAATCRACHLEEDGLDLVVHIQTFGPGCMECHDGIDRFGRGAFNHRGVAFPLEGTHVMLECQACHRNASTLAILQSTPQGCADCHMKQDVHEGRLGVLCEECHNAIAWEDATIDHALTRYPLEASHAELECVACHVDRAWVGLPLDCFGCHAGEDAHDRRYGEQCEACHRPTSWDDASFDHSLSRFPLTGAHQTIACEDCHTGATFAGLSTACASCHADPAYHFGLFGYSCEACHSTWAWRPAAYNGPHGFPYNHGGAGSTCATCHPSALTAYTCYGCHEHNQARIQSEHREEGIGNLNNCIRCHPSGREAEGGD